MRGQHASQPPPALGVNTLTKALRSARRRPTFFPTSKLERADRRAAMADPHTRALAAHLAVRARQDAPVRRAPLRRLSARGRSAPRPRPPRGKPGERRRRAAPAGARGPGGAQGRRGGAAGRAALGRAGRRLPRGARRAARCGGVCASACGDAVACSVQGGACSAHRRQQAGASSTGHPPPGRCWMPWSGGGARAGKPVRAATHSTCARPGHRSCTDEGRGTAALESARPGAHVLVLGGGGGAAALLAARAGDARVTAVERGRLLHRMAAQALAANAAAPGAAAVCLLDAPLRSVGVAGAGLAARARTRGCQGAAAECERRAPAQQSSPILSWPAAGTPPALQRQHSRSPGQRRGRRGAQARRCPRTWQPRWQSCTRRVQLPAARRSAAALLSSQAPAVPCTTHWRQQGPAPGPRRRRRARTRPKRLPAPAPCWVAARLHQAPLPPPPCRPGHSPLVSSLPPQRRPPAAAAARRSAPPQAPRARRAGGAGAGGLGGAGGARARRGGADARARGRPGRGPARLQARPERAARPPARPRPAAGARRSAHAPTHCALPHARARGEPDPGARARSVLGMGLLPALDYAGARLLAPGARVVPARVQVRRSRCARAAAAPPRRRLSPHRRPRRHRLSQSNPAGMRRLEHARVMRAGRARARRAGVGAAGRGARGARRGLRPVGHGPLPLAPGPGARRPRQARPLRAPPRAPGAAAPYPIPYHTIP